MNRLNKVRALVCFMPKVGRLSGSLLRSYQCVWSVSTWFSTYPRLAAQFWVGLFGSICRSGSDIDSKKNQLFSRKISRVEPNKPSFRGLRIIWAVLRFFLLNLQALRTESYYKGIIMVLWTSWSLIKMFGFFAKFHEKFFFLKRISHAFRTLIRNESFHP